MAKEISKLVIRLKRRPELQLALMTDEQIRKLAPSHWAALGTGGLTPAEVIPSYPTAHHSHHSLPQPITAHHSQRWHAEFGAP